MNPRRPNFWGLRLANSPAAAWSHKSSLRRVTRLRRIRPIAGGGGVTVEGECTVVYFPARDSWHPAMWQSSDMSNYSAPKNASAKNQKSSDGASASHSLYERPWYDSDGVVAAASIMVLPLGIWGVAKRRAMVQPGVSNFWHHTIPLWVAAIIPYCAPMAVYGFWRRTVADDAPTGISDYVGLVLSCSMTVFLIGVVAHYIRLIA